MPIYEYECDDCGYKEERIEAVDTDSSEDCPDCNCGYFGKVMSKTNFKLNGSCWARDGYAASGTYYGDPEGQGREE